MVTGDWWRGTNLTWSCSVLHCHCFTGIAMCNLWIKLTYTKRTFSPSAFKQMPLNAPTDSFRLQTSACIAIDIVLKMLI